MAEAASGLTVLERRMRAEWQLLGRLAAANPSRLGELTAVDRSIHLVLRKTPGLIFDMRRTGVPLSKQPFVEEHRLRVDYPEYFPAAPVELYLERPAVHPNIHPETGFVCLWDRHQIGNTVEHALHKTVAILGWRLSNPELLHVMQSDAKEEDAEALIAWLAAPELIGVLSPERDVPLREGVRRKRLS